MRRIPLLVMVLAAAGVGFLASQALHSTRTQLPVATPSSAAALAAADAESRAVAPAVLATPLAAAAGRSPSDDRELLEAIQGLRADIVALTRRLPAVDAKAGDPDDADLGWRRVVKQSIVEFRDVELKWKLEFAVGRQIDRIRTASPVLSPADEAAIRSFEAQLERIRTAGDASSMLRAASAAPLEYTPDDPRFEEYERTHADVFRK